MRPITLTHHDKNKDPLPSNIHNNVIYMYTYTFIIKRNDLNAVTHLQLKFFVISPNIITMLTLLTLQTVKVCQTFVSRQGNKLISSQKFNSIQSALCTKCIAGNLSSHLLIPFQTMADRNIDKYIYTVNEFIN